MAIAPLVPLPPAGNPLVDSDGRPNQPFARWLASARDSITAIISGGSITIPVPVSQGGTGADLSASGGANKFVRQNAVGANFDVVPLTTADLTDAASGTWTPTDQSGAGLTFRRNNALYLAFGSMVFVSTEFSYPVTASTANVIIGGLPFPMTAQTMGAASGITPAVSIGVGGSNVGLFSPVGLVWLHNSQFSNGTVFFSLIYPR